jgi:hypothetical protein
MLPVPSTCSRLTEEYPAHCPGVERLLLDHDFICAHGLYRISSAWMLEWIHTAASTNLPDLRSFLSLGSLLYSRRLRHTAAARKLQQAFFMDGDAPSPPSDAACGGLPADVGATAEAPLAVTPEVLKVWRLVGRAVASGEAPLVVGASGCGKSTVLAALAHLVGAPMQQYPLNPGEHRWGYGDACACTQRQLKKKSKGNSTWGCCKGKQVTYSRSAWLESEGPGRFEYPNLPCMASRG